MPITLADTCNIKVELTLSYIAILYNVCALFLNIFLYIFKSIKLYTINEMTSVNTEINLV